MALKTKTNKTISSPLVSAFNNIVSINRSGSTIKSTQQSYQGFLRFMDVEIKNIEAIELPKKSKIRSLSSLNVAATFGSAGSLLSGLASGALDAAGLVGNFFGGGKGGKKPGKPNPKAGRAIPKGKGVRLGGIRALGIVNAVFAGLDIAEGISEGESVGKASAGAGGALAGSIIGAALGSIGGPLGSIAGSMAGNFVGGYLGDRAYETVTGTGEQGLKSKQKEKLKAQEVKQKASAQLSSGLTMGSVLDKFDSVVSKFEKYSPGASSGSEESRSVKEGYGKKSNEGGGVTPPPKPTESYDGPVSGDTFFPLPKGILSNRSVGVQGGEYGAPRRYKGGHSGQDIGGLPPGSPVVAWKTGKVSYTGSVEQGDTIMTLDHGGGEQSVYKHVVPDVAAGTVVYGGQQIAKLFAARAYPEHLHFEIWKNGSHTNPNGSIAAAQKIGAPLNVAKAKEQAEKKKSSSTSGATSGTKPTAILAAGTNDYADPKSAAAGITKSIKELQSKGYNVVVVPPNESGKFAGVSKSVQEAASVSGATIEKGKYDQNDPLHLQMSESSRIREKYGKNAQIIGDSNAVRIAGGSMQDVPGQRVVGAGTKDISKFAQNMGRVAPAVAPALPPMQSTIVATPMKPPSMQMQQYPTYNQQQSTTTIIPMMMSTGGGGGQQKPMVISTGGGSGGGETIVLPGPSSSQVLNSLFKTMLLTNLSGT